MKKFILLAGVAVFWFSLYIYIPYLTPELLALGLTASVTGVIVALHSLAQMIVRFPAGIRASTTGKHKWMIVSGMLVSAAAAAIMYFWPDPVLFAVGNAVSGFSSAMYVGFTVLYAKYYPPQQSAKAMGYVSAGANLGIFAAFVAGGFAYEKGGIHLIFLIAAFTALGGFILSVFVKDETTKPAVENMQDLLRVMKNKQLVMSAVLCIIVKLAVFGTAFSFTPKAAEDIGASGIVLGILNAVFIAASVLGSMVVASRWGRKTGDTALSVTGFACLAAYACLIPFVKIIWVFGLIQFVGGLGYASLTTIFMANAVRKLPDEQKSAGMGMYQGIYSLGSTLGPIAVGCMTELLSAQWAFILVGILALCGLGLTLTARRRGLLQ